jgi:hypothetical protein
MREADRVRLAKEAITKTGNSIPSLEGKVRAIGNPNEINAKA